MNVICVTYFFQLHATPNGVGGVLLLCRLIKKDPQ